MPGPEKTKMVKSEQEEVHASSSGVRTSLRRLWGPTRITRTFWRMEVIYSTWARMGYTSHPFCCMGPGYSKHGFLVPSRMEVIEAPGKRGRSSGDRG